MAFARELGVKYQSCVAWVKKRRDAAVEVVAMLGGPVRREQVIDLVLAWRWAGVRSRLAGGPDASYYMRKFDTSPVCWYNGTYVA